MSQDTPKALQGHHEYMIGWSLYQDCGLPFAACTNEEQRKGHKAAQAAERAVDWEDACAYYQRTLTTASGRAAQVERNISEISEKPIIESHLRTLAPLPPEAQRVVWQQAGESAPNGKVTAAHVQGAEHTAWA